VIPGSSFGPMAMYPEMFQEGSSLVAATDELPLRVISVYLGNFDAIRLLTSKTAPETTQSDGMLHLAAILALPKFVEWLLETHHPDEKADEYDNMIPLACVCVPKPQVWCKIANGESDWKSQQQDTMRLLANVTNASWRKRNMTILHLAMEHGLGTAEAMIKALDIRHDPEKHKKYVYIDRDGIEYSPQQYVEKLWGGSANEKKTLISSLDEVFAEDLTRWGSFTGLLGTRESVLGMGLFMFSSNPKVGAVPGPLRARESIPSMEIPGA
jgi:hypothetical protein